jgi:hypothetical protein
MVDIIVGDEQWMKLGEDGTQSHVQGRATPADRYKRMTAGPPRNWSDGFTMKIKAECGGLCVMECKRCKANLSPANPATTKQRHKCTRQALAAAGVRSSPRKHAREEEEEEEEEEVEEVDCVGQPVAKKRHIKAFALRQYGDLTQALRKDVVSAFKNRRSKHYHPAQPSAFMLHPTNFEMQGKLVLPN